MNICLRLSLIVAITIYFTCIYLLLKKKNLNLKYTLIWIFSGIIMTIVVLFPGILNLLSNKLGIVEPVNGLFSVCIFLILLILMSITAIVSKMNEKNKKLVQQYALLEKRLREIEQTRIK